MAKRNFDNAETLLKVEHLCQYFKMDGSELKAVDDVNFEIKKGEVFGLVGESGCGKTTTGRSIIKLYNITGGNVFFKGIRIAAGKRGYENAIAKAKADYKAAVKEHPDQEAQLKAAMEKTVSEQKEAMKLAMEEQKSCDKEYAKQQTAAVKAKYAPLLEKGHRRREGRPPERVPQRAAQGPERQAGHPDPDDLPGPHCFSGSPYDRPGHHC